MTEVVRNGLTTPEIYTVGVRTLCEFTCKQGDLDLRFTPSPTAQQGIQGHGIVASRRDKNHQSEVSLSSIFGTRLKVQGRADGYDPVRGRVEEVKTFRGQLSRQPDNHRHLHWAQVKVYGWLLCEKFGLTEIELALVYFDVGSQEETVFSQPASASALRLHFELLCERFMDWADRESAHRLQRDGLLLTLAFPHAGFRDGQRTLAESVYKAARAGCCLMAQAPTGIGKTVGTLFPLLKACPSQRLDKIFFVSAKTSGRRMALDAMSVIQGSEQGRQASLRVLELVARDKACEHPDRACHGASCPLARGFYDRLPAARLACVVMQGPWDQAAVRAMAQAHGVCPYYLGQELAHWADVTVGDYNHYFDLHAMLHGMGQSHAWRFAVLVDEAHNLLERARKMYSAELDPHRLRRARDAAPLALKKSLDRLDRAWKALTTKAEPGLKKSDGNSAPSFEPPHDSCGVHAEVPDAFQAALQRCLAAMGDHLADSEGPLETALQDFYFEALHFSRLTESFGSHSMFDLVPLPRDDRPAGSSLSRLHIRNVVPAPFLRSRFSAAHSVTLFSATLRPWSFYSETLGLPGNTAFIDVAAPFKAEQLQVSIARHISTRYHHRHLSIEPIVELMGRQCQARPGNYLAFFSSFEYLDQVASKFEARHPHIAAWRQSRGMTECEQARFIGRFIEDGQGVGFAVLGGAFSEGIDLPGKRLIGAFIATLGLPQVNPVNEQMCQRMEKLLGQGHRYTYLYPGLQKVVQAAGRVIRTPSDQGVVHLMDDRFHRDDVRQLLPDWWALPAS